ncbi:hypothetical protein KAX17_04130 [Candidatus Bipolaricaulota bacterium]|nr:hypothetical protein [Candidatus Bipolaricaulota bacterium]
MLSFFKREIKVPPFQHYMASEDNMDREQRCFYATWEKQWNKEKPLSVQGNISYLFCYVYKVLALPPAKAVSQLTRLIEAYPTEEKFLEYCKAWLSDCYVLLGDYRRALDVYPPIFISSRGATCTDDILSLKLQIGEHIAGRDILTLNGPKVTEWGKEHLDEVGAYLNVILSAYEKHNNINLLERWKITSYQYPYSVFRGTFLSSAANLPCYSFSRNEEAITFVREKTRDAENSVREEMSIPRVGEGWIAETELFYELRYALPNTEVLHHARPKWLGRQHLDIFIPEYSVALEFQGAQHDEPVEYFGGEAAFQATKRRDARKKRMCTKNGIRLIQVRPGYDLQKIVHEIRDAANGCEEMASNTEFTPRG